MTHTGFMNVALSLANRARGMTAENPPVGCIIVKNGVILGQGCTQSTGRPHAETQALAQAMDRYGTQALNGADVYVTLEPCAHIGKTGSCAQALAEAKIGRVFYAIEDPDPRTKGAGAARLQHSGIETHQGLCAEEARQITRGFLSRIQRKRPWLILKVATSLDGRIALASGESKWITGPQARLRTHLMRAQSDAILIGSGAALTDNPSLTIRINGLKDTQLARIILDSQLRLSPHAQLVQTIEEHTPLWIYHSAAAKAETIAQLTQRGAELKPLPTENKGLDLHALLNDLGARGVNTVFCEGGGQLAANLLKANLVDELFWFQAGILLGSDSIPVVKALGLDKLSLASRWHLKSTAEIGADMLHIWQQYSPLPL